MNLWIVLLAVLLGASLGTSLMYLIGARRWTPGLRRLRRRVLGKSWRPVLMSPYVATPPASGEERG